MSIVGYLQALNNLITHSLMIYEELKYDSESEKDVELEDGEKE